jgi:hypothetical protein
MGIDYDYGNAKLTVALFSLPCGSRHLCLPFRRNCIKAVSPSEASTPSYICPPMGDLDMRGGFFREVKMDDAKRLM